jgi:uncharacterized SAM-binding protein YcdF (DUF218 family)
VKLLLLILALPCMACAFLFFHGEFFSHAWHRYLVVSAPLSKADAIIVLGGEPLARPQEAAHLFREGVSPKVFVTGVGDAVKIRKVLLGAGVPASAIILESKATTTYTNATLLKPLLEEAHVHTAVIVTSPFHTRRALATFQKVMPDIRFGVTDASIGWWKRPEGQSDLNRFAAIELLKTAEYWLLYGVSPILRPETRNLKPEA